jgi:lysozyme
MVTINPRVVDLSHWDDVQDKFAGLVRFGGWGVINKVTEGTASIDASFGWRRQPAKDAGLLYGGYHFLHAGNPDRQVDWFLQHLGDPTGLLVAYDHETEQDSNGHSLPVMSLDDLKHTLELTRDRIGRWPWLYSGNLIKEQLGNSKDPFWKNIKLWLPQYGFSFVYPPAFNSPPLWQYTGDGRGPMPHNVPGIVIRGSGIDINHFGGTRDELAAIWAS